MPDGAPVTSKGSGRRFRLRDSASPHRLLRAALDRLIGRFFVLGTLVVRYPDGSEAVYQGAAGPRAGLEVKSWGAVAKVLLNPALALGECFTDGSVIALEGGIYGVLDLFLDNIAHGASYPMLALHNLLALVLKRAAQFNPAGRARRNVARHYDLDAAFYALLLDRDMQYSCAYFAPGIDTLDAAQAAKKQHIAAKLMLDRPGLRVLDIGSGWGGMAMTLARDYGAEVTGITLSTEQLAIARARAQDAGLAGRVRFELMDYRAVTGPYDRIVSVGMFEHVGINHYGRFFQVLRQALAPGGVALVHAIGRSRGPATTNKWIARHIFPGGYSPALSEVLPAIEASGLVATDIEVLRLHYAQTLRLWRANLELHRPQVAAMYDEAFCRMFEFYLAGAELAFRRSGHMVWQAQLMRDQGPVPLTRDYLYPGVYPGTP